MKHKLMINYYLDQVFGDTLTENPGVAQSSFGAHRVITDRWKGMSAEQKADIQKIREQQVRLINHYRILPY